MGFSAKQVQALRRSLSPRQVRTREAHGRELFYIEGWYAITEANRISASTAGIGRPSNPNVCSPAKIAGLSWRSISPGCGLLCTPTAPPSCEKVTAPVKDVAHLRVRSTTLRSKLQKPTPPNGRWPRLASPLGWRSMGTARPLPLQKRRRFSQSRPKAHLRFVASQPCLICGRQPSDPHHLRFAQPRALGLKVSDEFTVPLCRGHHRQLHQAGDEAAWWDNLNINALEIAKGLWGDSRQRTFPKVAQASQQQAPTPQAAPHHASKLPNEPN